VDGSVLSTALRQQQLPRDKEWCLLLVLAQVIAGLLIHYNFAQNLVLFMFVALK
jgi:hypothetical protein